MSQPELEVKGYSEKVSVMSKGYRAERRRKASVWSALTQWPASALAGLRMPRMLSLLAILLAVTMVISTQTAFARPTIDCDSPAGDAAASQQNNTQPILGQTTYMVVFDPLSAAEKQVAHDRIADMVETNGGRVLYVFTIIDAMAVCVPADAVGQLQAVAGVEYVQPEVEYQLSLDQVDDQINLDTLLGPSGINTKYDGTGITICTIDSGVAGNHPDLQGKIADFYDFVPGNDQHPAPGVTYDYNGHGTFIASEIVGSGIASAGSDGVLPGIWKGTIPGYKLKEGDPAYKELRGPFRGIAPNAKLIPLRVSIGTGASSLAIEEAIDFAYKTLHPDIISMSMNSGIEDETMNRFVRNAVNSGIIFVVSAGNAGPNLKTVQCPANLPEVITVGSVNRDDSVSSFSSKGPTNDGQMKPDITAVGETVLGAKVPYTLDCDNGQALNFTRYYQEYSGTSMATPEVTGVVALMLQSNAALKGNPAQVKAILINTARQPLGCPPEGNMAWGHGIVDAYAAVKMAESGNYPKVVQPVATARFEKAVYNVYEGNTNLEVNVILDKAVNEEIKVKCEALSGSGAVPNRDFSIPADDMLTFSPGATSATYKVVIKDNQMSTGDLAFTLKLTPISNVAIPTSTCKVIIKDTDQAEVYFTADSYTVKAGTVSYVPVKVMADWTKNPSAGDITVWIKTTNGSANSVDDYEAIGQDTAIGQKLEFVKPPTGIMIAYQTVQIPIKAASPAGLKYFTVKLLNPENAMLGSSSTDTVWIKPSSTDTSLPYIELSVSPSPVPASGWYKTDVAAKLKATDSDGINYLIYGLNGPETVIDGTPSGSSTASAETTVEISDEGNNTLKYRAADNSGKTSSGGPVYFNIDKSAPLITYEQSPVANQFGWVNTVPVKVRFTATDQLSGLSGPATYSPPDFMTSGYHVASWTAEDNAGNTATLAAVNIDTKAPVFVNTINAPIIPLPLAIGGTTIVANCSFTDISGIGKPEWVNWTWDDGKPATVATCTISGTTGDYMIKANNSHTYATTGVFTVNLSATDAAYNYNSTRFDYIVIYDPNGGFTTGGGWIDSPAGAYRENKSLTGKATFGFESKYKKGATVPMGNTQFQFHVANMNFKSTSYEWLVVSGTKATFKGLGTINGAGTYQFLLSAIDGTPDKFRIKIWDRANPEVIVYDNQIGASETATPTMAIAGGMIVVHK